MLQVAPGQSLSVQQAAQVVPQACVPAGQAVQRRAAPGPLLVQIKPLQQIWFPSHGCPAVRQPGAAPAERLPRSPRAAAATLPAAPSRTRRREVVVAKARVKESKRSGSIGYLRVGGRPEPGPGPQASVNAERDPSCM